MNLNYCLLLYYYTNQLRQKVICYYCGVLKFHSHATDNHLIYSINDIKRYYFNPLESISVFLTLRFSVGKCPSATSVSTTHIIQIEQQSWRRCQQRVHLSTDQVRRHALPVAARNSPGIPGCRPNTHKNAFWRGKQQYIIYIYIYMYITYIEDIQIYMKTTKKKRRKIAVE